MQQFEFILVGDCASLQTIRCRKRTRILYSAQRVPASTLCVLHTDYAVLVPLFFTWQLTTHAIVLICCAMHQFHGRRSGDIENHNTFNGNTNGSSIVCQAIVTPCLLLPWLYNYSGICSAYWKHISTQSNHLKSFSIQSNFLNMPSVSYTLSLSVCVCLISVGKWRLLWLRPVSFYQSVCVAAGCRSQSRSERKVNKFVR